MEGILNRYWRRTIWGYKRLHVSDRRKRETLKLGGKQKRRRRRTWQIKLSAKLTIPKISSPKKIALWLRDSYVQIMLGLANTIGSSATGYGGDAASTANGGFGRAPPPKEYDEKMLIHMYKSFVMAQGKLLPQDPAPNPATTRIVTTF